MDGWIHGLTDGCALILTPSLLLQVLVGGPGPEENAPAGRGTGGAGHLGGVPGWGSTQLHQSGLPQLRAHKSEPEGPWAVQLRGCPGQQQVVYCRWKCQFKSFCFLFSQDHIYKLMKSDSYTRFLRSNVYQDLLLARKKVSFSCKDLYSFSRLPHDLMQWWRWRSNKLLWLSKDIFGCMNERAGKHHHQLSGCLGLSCLFSCSQKRSRADAPRWRSSHAAWWAWTIKFTIFTITGLMWCCWFIRMKSRNDYMQTHYSDLYQPIY